MAIIKFPNLTYSTLALLFFFGVNLSGVNTPFIGAFYVNAENYSGGFNNVEEATNAAKSTSPRIRGVRGTSDRYEMRLIKMMRDEEKYNQQYAKWRRKEQSNIQKQEMKIAEKDAKQAGKIASARYKDKLSDANREIARLKKENQKLAKGRPAKQPTAEKEVPEPIKPKVRTSSGGSIFGDLNSSDISTSEEEESLQKQVEQLEKGDNESRTTERHSLWGHLKKALW